MVAAVGQCPTPPSRMHWATRPDTRRRFAGSWLAGGSTPDRDGADRAGAIGVILDVAAQTMSRLTLGCALPPSQSTGNSACLRQWLCSALACSVSPATLLARRRVPWPLRPLGRVEMARVDRGAKGGEGPARGAISIPRAMGLLFTRPPPALSAATISKMPLKPPARHDRRYAASLRPASCLPQETHSRF
jgi:hypothetical protein